MSILKSSRRKFLHQLGNASLLIPFGSLSAFADKNYWNLAVQHDYHFTQPNVPAPVRIFEPNEMNLGGFKAVAWNTPISGITSQQNYVTATISSTSPYYNRSENDIATVQFNQWWGRDNGINAWDGRKYGYNVNNVKLSFGAMISIPENSGSAIGYSTFYLRGKDLLNNVSYWLQFSLFDERGYHPSGNSDEFYFDTGLTNEPAFTTQLGRSRYVTLNPDSNLMQSSPFSTLKFFGGSVSRQQLYNLMSDFKKAKGIKISPEPDVHRIFAFGATPELGAADPGGRMKFTMKNLYLRTEY